MLTSKGYLYTCGNGGSGRLGHGSEALQLGLGLGLGLELAPPARSSDSRAVDVQDDVFTPTLVRFFSDPLQGSRKVDCGEG